ncbi:CHAP domain-containing protein [Candidatus Saccharibacteria bacterium]|nr:CHAP domain-containing protein [Candidatus Saccharibacteria bacterium]
MSKLVSKNSQDPMDKVGLVEKVEKKRKAILNPRTKRGKMWRLFLKYSFAIVAIGALLVVGSRGQQAQDRSAQYWFGADGTSFNVSFIDVLETKVVAQSAQSARLASMGNAAEAAESLAALFATGGILDRPITIIVASRGVDVHRVLEGETVASLSADRGITQQTFRWANNLTANAQVSAGQDVLLPAIDGVIYAWAAGDTIVAVAERFRANAAEIIAYNELDNREVAVEERIFIPNGILPENMRPGFRPPTQNVFTPGITAGRGGGYARGHCTYYAYNRRRELGLPVMSGWGNAATWLRRAQAAGFATGTQPAVGAIMHNYGGRWGHVAIVERVYADRIVVSEMNFAGAWNRVTFRTLPMDLADGTRDRAAGRTPTFHFIY